MFPPRYANWDYISIHRQYLSLDSNLTHMGVTMAVDDYIKKEENANINKH